VAECLHGLARAHPEAVEVLVQPTQHLLNQESARPDFELVYVLDQKHHELIECQSRSRSSTAVADKIRKIKALSNRNRFVFVFEDGDALGPEHKRILESDGVMCLTFEEFQRKITQLDVVLSGLEKGLGLKYAAAVAIAAALSSLFYLG
jgi:hypothetical protein